MGNNTYSTAGNFTWTPPWPALNVVKVQIWAGGGGGGGGNATSSGSAGAGGAYAELSAYNVSFGSNYNLTVGANGANGGTNANGTNGTNSVWRHANNANAGWAMFGARGFRPSAAANSAGGTAVGSNGNVTWGGGNGANRNGTNARQAGSGGGGGGNTAAGTAGTNGTNAAGGAGGNAGGGNGGGANVGAAGGAATQPGGGGAGGSNSNFAGGPGARGRIIISWNDNMTVPAISDNGAGNDIPTDITVSAGNIGDTGASTDGFPSGGGGITLIQKTPNTTAPDAGNVEALTTTAFGSSVAEGSMIVACCTQSQSSGTIQPVFTDSKGNTWYIDLDVLTSDAINRLTIAHCFVAAGKGGTGFTVTATTTGHTHYLDLGAAEFSGIDISLVAGGSGSNSGNGTSTSPTSNQVTVSGNHVYIGLLTFSVGASTITPAWTQLHEDETWVNSPFGSQYLISSGNQTSTWTMGTSRPWAAGVVAYKEAAIPATGIGVELPGLLDSGSAIEDLILDFGAIIKEVLDSGTASDIISDLLVSFNLPDTASGQDLLSQVMNQFGITDIGTAIDVISATFLAALIDSGVGTDAVLIIAKELGLSDVGSSVDAVPSAQVQSSIVESGAGTDALSSLLASLSLQDTGAGIDTAQGFILIAMTDTATGVDSIYQIQVQSTVPDAGAGIDTPMITVIISVSDSTTGFDQSTVLATINVTDLAAGADLIAVTSQIFISIIDAAGGTDQISSISVIIPTMVDSGNSVDMMSLLQAALSIIDLGYGTDIAINLTLLGTFNKLTVTFTGKKPGLRLRGKKPSLDITGKKPDVEVN